MASPLLSLLFIISWRQDFRRLLDLVSSELLRSYRYSTRTCAPVAVTKVVLIGKLRGTVLNPKVLFLGTKNVYPCGLFVRMGGIHYS